MPKCQVCKMSRTRLHTCARCEMKLCGCCSYPSARYGPKERVCCYPGSPCSEARRQEVKAAHDKMLDRISNTDAG